jgi:hypothetical protein
MVLALAAAVWAGIPPLSFAPAVDVGLGPPDCMEGVDCSDGPTASAAGDFNGDTNLDIATANNATDDVTVLLGDGAGGLAYGSTLPAGGAPTSIAAGNLDGGTVLDLVVSNALDNNINVYIGNGDGTFDDPVSYTMGSSPETVVLADFNGDQNLDVATTDFFGDSVTVRLGDGEGMFGQPMTTTGTGDPTGMAVGRLDGNNTLDLAVSLNFDGQVAFLFGNGDGTFTYDPENNVDVGESPTGLAIAALDGGAADDVAVVAEFDDSLWVLLGNGDGTFQTPVSYVVGSFPESVAAGDYNADGIADLATADSFGTTDFEGSVSILLGNGNGTFADAQFFEVGVGPFGLTAADLSGDRLPDLITANREDNDVSVLVNTGTPPTPSCVGDCNGDGEVTINELIVGVNIALGNAAVDSCPAFDANGNGMVTINELIAAVNNASEGCPAP